MFDIRIRNSPENREFNFTLSKDLASNDKEAKQYAMFVISILKWKIQNCDVDIKEIKEGEKYGNYYTGLNF